MKDILLLGRDRFLGGILNQCVHNGFGLHRFQAELTGPEYAGRFIAMLEDAEIQVKTDTMVLSVAPDKAVRFVNPADGCQTVKAKAVVLAMGCRERTRGAISVPGARYSGIFTAGAAQRFINMEGQMVGRRTGAGKRCFAGPRPGGRRGAGRRLRNGRGRGGDTVGFGLSLAIFMWR